MVFFVCVCVWCSVHTCTRAGFRGRFVALDIAKGLKYLHEELKMVHMDIKSPNGTTVGACCICLCCVCRRTHMAAQCC